MSAAPDRGDRAQHDDWSQLDDTLADGPAPVDVPAAARPWLAEQRLVHGLLRALCSGDAAAREGRVAAILERIDAAGRPRAHRHWLLVSTAALLLATLGVWLALPPSLPTAEAAVARAADELARDVDRRFRVRVVRLGRERRELVRHEFDLVTRPGSRFLIEGRFAFADLPVTEGRVGCDGTTIWVLPEDPRLRRSGPLAERQRLLEGLGDLLDAGYLDVHALLTNLPHSFRLRVVERLRDEAGNRVLQIRARRRGVGGAVRLRSAELLVDEASGMVTHLDAELRVVGQGVRRVTIDYLGRVEPGAVDYSRPW